MKRIFTLLACLPLVFCDGQSVMTPELLWRLGRLSPTGLARDGASVLFHVTTYNVEENKSRERTYVVPAAGGEPRQVSNADELLVNRNISPDGRYEILERSVKITPVTGRELYPDMNKSDVRIYTDLMYRHWDEWEDGAYNHLIVRDKALGKETDIMKDEPYDCPGEPFGGSSDYAWSPDGRFIIYSAKKKSGVAYTLSTNSDLYAYEVATGKTTSITEGMEGYDTHPLYSKEGVLGWLNMKRDGYESDKNDLFIRTPSGIRNLTSSWNGTVSSFIWSADGSKIYFTAPTDGTVQLFELPVAGGGGSKPKQITLGDFDIGSLTGQIGNRLVVTRTDMNHAAELYNIQLSDGKMTRLTHINDSIYSRIELSKIERRSFTTTDKKQMLSWVIYPPDFDPSKKYPTLLYCQGGPQSALSQFYSYRWNFQLMAAKGYIIVAPNRRGMPGYGVEWNEEISKDWGGQAMRDYLTAIDEMGKEPFVDTGRLGCVGASFGGYSVFYLAGKHEGRFKTFIAHDGVFDLKSMYGTTEEMWFVNWDLGGAYWDTDNQAAMKSYREFDPSNFVGNWDTPILIIQGGRDYRVPIGQGLEAFQAAQLHGIRSKLLYFPEESHWVLSAQNAIIWQREFFKWLDETL